MCTSTEHDVRSLSMMHTVNIDSSNDHFHKEYIDVCNKCDCMVLDDYSTARAKRSIAGEKKYTPLFEGSHL